MIKNDPSHVRQNKFGELMGQQEVGKVDSDPPKINFCRRPHFYTC